MFNSFMWIYITPILIISPILTMSFNSWFSIWMSLELNLMAFIPFIIFLNKFYKELSIKYFLIQSISSSMLIFSSNFNSLLMFNNNNFYQYMNILLNISILIKIGASPFHTWFLNLMNNLNWTSCFILSTFQKISPFIVMMFIFNKNIIYYSIILSSVISAIWGNNHQSLRLILSYSSINHISWLLMNLMISEMLWTLYFICYFIINMSIMLILNKFKIFYINEIFMLNKFKFNKFILMLNMISISGLPPLLGFLMKWISIFFINENKSFMLIFIMMILSLMTFLFYSRLIISILILNKLNNKIKIFNKIFVMNNNLIYTLFMNSFLNLWILNIWIF